jgi:hydroxylaminobenzene mutase
MRTDLSKTLSRRLMRWGISLFLLGLLTGFAIPVLSNPRLGLSSHLEGVQNGMLLLILGLIWPRLQLSARMLRAGFFLAIFGTYTNWGITLLAGIWNAGSDLMPIAGGSAVGTAWQEVMVKAGLLSLAIAMVLVSIFVLVGLQGDEQPVFHKS